MYILKIKGSAKIPDYIQVRDSQFTLIAYFKADSKIQDFNKLGLSEKEDEIRKIIKEMPYGKIIEVS